MANRIVGNIVIVDSAMGNAPLLDINSGNFLKTGWKVNCVMLSLATSDSTITLSGANTANVLLSLNRFVPSTYFAQPQYFPDLKVPTMTAGTAFIYLA